MKDELPINDVLPQVQNTLLNHNKLVLQAPPGAGKTTALPLALLNEPWLKDKQIIMLEPRRLAVRTSATRMAELLGEKVGERVGYQIKLESVQSKKTKILIVTEGILTRKIQSDPSLENIALVIFDEFHERSLHADLSLALCLESQSILREDLKLLIMSATLNTKAISSLLDNAPILQSEGRMFPVERIYLDTNTPTPNKRELPHYVAKKVLQLLHNHDGNILVFLSGVREIKTVEKLLQSTKPKNVYLSTLYGNLTKNEQNRAIQAPAEGSRKVVLSTNIAQTSLTIEGIKIVVDSGLHNVSVFSSFSGIDTLENHAISLDAATQRAGRAGRLSAGKAYHLWQQSKILSSHDIPAILLSDLTQLRLELALWGSNTPNTLKWLDAPPLTAIAHANTLLTQLRALDKKGYITPHGKTMSQLPLHPRFAHMLIKAKALGWSYEASLLAVLLTEKDIYTHAYNSADIKERINILHDVVQGKHNNSSLVNSRQCHLIISQAKRLEKIQNKTLNSDILSVLLAFAYPDRIASLRHRNQGVYLLCNGKGALLQADDTLFNASFLVVSNLNAKKTNSTIYKAIELSRTDIETYLDDYLHSYESVTWNEEHQRVESRHITRLGAIVLKEVQVKNTNQEEITSILIEEIEALGLDTLAWDKKSKTLQDRVNFINAHGGKLPNFTAQNLLENMDEWLAPYLNNISTLKACKTIDLYGILLAKLTYEQTQILDKLAPIKIKVASGSLIAIDYTNPSQPVLSVRLQEMFGTQETPSIMQGKITLMLHLLSPASRPMQVTKDLANFWAHTYDEVKKELRGKYKRHYWPDDPLHAIATSKSKKNMDKK